MPRKLALVPMKARIASIRSVYASAAERIVALLSSLDPATYTVVESGRIMERIKLIIADLNIGVRMWAPDSIRAAYQESAAIARTRLELIGAKKLSERRYNPARHDKKIGQLVNTVTRDFFKANRTIEKTARKYLSVVAQAAAGVAKIQVQMFEGADSLPYIRRLIKRAREGAWAGGAGATGEAAIAAGMGSSLSRTSVSRQIRDYLMRKIGGGDFINIRGRNYSLKAYSELVARTRMREAQTEATKELARQHDNDLVVFSSHDSPCEECRQYEGQVFSLSGDSDKYDKLPAEAEPPVHPNCEHNLNPTSENALNWR